MNVAVIGAGMAGLTVARRLQAAGRTVTVFDKSKGTGGRLASRSLNEGWVDHGAPYFSADNSRFADFLPGAISPDHLQRWEPTVKGALGTDEKVHFIGVPRNSAVTRALLGDLTFQPSTRIGRLEKSSAGWELYNDGESLLGSWDQVVVAAPAPQALALVRDHATLAGQISRAKMEPSWVVALQTADRQKNLADVSIAPHPALRRITFNTAKKGRGAKNVYLVQATKEWSMEHLEEAPDRVGQKLKAIFCHIVPDAVDCTILLTHRWRYAFTEQAVGEACLWDSKHNLGACGDWCLGRRVEDAWQSGEALALEMLR